MDSELNIRDYLVPGRHAHLVGIGGVSMRPLGLVLKDIGMVITGSDMNSSVSTEELQEKGIEVHIGHSAEHIKGAECIIRTAAVHNDNPEIAAARAQGIPVFERAQAWGVIMQHYQNAICISGTHGKTTTTSMVTHIFLEAGKDPTVMIGGKLPILGAGHRVGQGDDIILESCEYCNSFLNFFPTTAVVLNVEEDHLDFFKDLEDIKASFRKFAELVPENGHILVNGDDANAMDALKGLPVITFGMHPGYDVYAENISDDFRSLDIIADGKKYCHLDLKVIGSHNACNAAAAAAVAWVHGIPAEAVERGLAAFHGAERRMQYKGTVNGAEIYDDYAHHPSELQATINTARLMQPKRLIVVFQPHTYSRTKALFEEFVSVLQSADLCVLAEIYAAREQNTIGISSRDLQKRINGAMFFRTLPQITEYLSSVVSSGDMVITVGAGDIYQVADMLVKQ